MNFINMCDQRVIKHVKDYIGKYKLRGNNAKLQQFIDAFPFAKLLECAGFNEELIMDIIDIIGMFAHLSKLYQRPTIEYTVDFLLLQVNFHAKSLNANRILFKSMKLLYLICTKLQATNDLTQRLNVQRICEILIDLFASNRHNAIKSYGKRILIAFVACGNAIETCEAITHCVEAAFIHVDPVQDKMELLTLLNTILRRCKHICRFEAALGWFEIEYPSLIYCEESKADALCLVVDSISICLERETDLSDFNRKLLAHFRADLHEICLLISRVTTRDAFPEKAAVKCKLANVLFVTLKCECLLIALDWYGGFEKLRTDVNVMLESAEDWPVTLSDVFFFVAYIQCNNNRLQWSSDIILDAIRRRIDSRQFIPLIILRSIAFLYSIVAETTVSQFDRTKLFILKELTVYKQAITSHPLQIQWLLREAPSQLKFHALRVCIDNDPNDYVHIFNEVLDYKALIHYVIETNDSMAHKQWAISVLRLQKSYKLSNYILHSIKMNSSMDPELAALLLQIEPVTPLNGSTCFALVQHLKNIMHRVENATSLKYLLRFVGRILAIYKSDPQFYLDFCDNSSRSVPFLIHLCGCNDEALSKSAISLLKLLIRLQGRHKISVTESFKINLVPSLCGSDDKMTESLGLLSLVLRRRAIVPVLKVEEVNLVELFHKLQDVAFAIAKPIVFKCLICLINNWEYLVSSCVTLVLIDEYFVNGPTDRTCFAEFLRFLRIWLKKVHRHGIPLCGLTVYDLEFYLHNVSGEYSVKNIMDVINQIADIERKADL